MCTLVMDGWIRRKSSRVLKHLYSITALSTCANGIAIVVPVWVNRFDRHLRRGH